MPGSAGIIPTGEAVEGREVMLGNAPLCGAAAPVVKEWSLVFREIYQHAARGLSEQVIRCPSG